MLAKFIKRWKNLSSLSRQQRNLFWRSLLLLKIASGLLYFFRYQDLYGRLKRMTPLEETEANEQSLAQARSTSKIVELAARRRVTNATCLRRSLVLWYLLRREKIDSDLQLGVRKEGDKLRGHAWVEIGGSVINDDADIAKKYTVMDLERNS